MTKYKSLVLDSFPNQYITSLCHFFSFFLKDSKKFIGTYDKKNVNGAVFYEDSENNNLIWQEDCNEWRISNDTNHKGQCDKGEPLNFDKDDVMQKCIIGSDGKSEGKYGSKVLPGYTVACTEDQSKSI